MLYPKTGNKARISPIPLLFNMILEVLARKRKSKGRNKARKRNKVKQIRKEQIKQSLFKDEIMIHIENLRNLRKEKLFCELVSRFAKITG